MQYPVYSEVTSCRDCYKCVRVCPVKAIQMKEGHAMIQHDRCIFCGRCVPVCPTHAKKVRDDVSRVKIAMSSGRKAICSLDSTFSSEFAGREKELLYALSVLGFDAVSETAIGAQLVSSAIDRYKERTGSCNWISTSCTSVVELIKKYHPERVDDLAPVPSPLQTHAAYLRKLYGDDILIVAIGPCIARKHEADLYPGYPDYALTFTELKNWMRLSGINLDTIEVKKEVEFVPKKAGLSSLYSIEGGQIVSLATCGNPVLHPDAVALSGAEQIKSALRGKTDNDAFLELMGCDGSCINGPATNRGISLADRKKRARQYISARLEEGDLFEGDDGFVDEILEKGYGIIGAERPSRADSFHMEHTEEEIRKALEAIGKFSRKDELNCGGCGYSTCREMAIAYLEGMADPEMCATRMRKEAQSKVDMLLRTIPMGVVIVDNDLNIADCNIQFLKQFGEIDDTVLDEKMLSMVRSLPVERFVPFAAMFRRQFNLESPGLYRMHYKDRFIRVRFFLVEKNRLLGAMFVDVTSPTVKRETVVRKAEDVIQKSLETVQQIASLLGENAAETEIMLNSLIDAFSVHSDEGGKAFSAEDDRDIT